MQSVVALEQVEGVEPFYAKRGRVAANLMLTRETGWHGWTRTSNLGVNSSAHYHCATRQNWCHPMESNHIASAADLQSAVRPSALSVGKTWWAKQDLNLQPSDYESPALTS